VVQPKKTIRDNKGEWKVVDAKRDIDVVKKGI